jgi:RimJ/RimL family protein N-acetyltransferase
VQKSDGSFVGRGGLLTWDIDDAKEIEIAYMVDKFFWRQGFGAEMAKGLVRHGFAVTDASHLIALTDHEHQASIKTAEAAGLTFWKNIVMDGVSSAVYKIDRFKGE